MRLSSRRVVIVLLASGACRHGRPERLSDASRTVEPSAQQPVSHPADASATSAASASSAPIQPSAAPASLRDDFVVQIVAMEDAFCARVESGRVYCWGSGAHGEIGDGAGADRVHPTAVTGIRHATAIAAHGQRACVVEGGRVSCWGDMMERAPNGGDAPRRAPAPIGDEHDVVDVAVGVFHVWMRHANGEVTYRTLSVGANTGPERVELPAPATALASGDTAICASTSAGVFCQSFTTPLYGGRPQAPPQRIMDASPRLDVSDRDVCGLIGGHIECVDFTSSVPRTRTVAAPSPRSFAFIAASNFVGQVQPLCVIGDGDPVCYFNGYPPEQTFSPGPDVVALVGNRRHCALLRSGEVRCEAAGQQTFARVAIGTPAPPRGSGVLAPELAQGGFVEAARIAANGRVEYCVAHHAEVGDAVTNRQCFALEPEGSFVADMPAWHEPRPTAAWESDRIEVSRPDGRREFPFPVPSGANGEQSAIVSPHGDLVAAIAPAVHGTRSVAVLDVATHATLFTRTVPQSLTNNFALLGGFLVNMYANDMIDGGTFSVEFFAPTGGHQRLGRCRATADRPCAWELAPARVGILTNRGVSVFDGPRATREQTGFDPPGEAVSWLLEDPARHRMYALHDEPLGTVDVFDLTRRRVVRTVAPRVQ